MRIAHAGTDDNKINLLEVRLFQRSHVPDFSDLEIYYTLALTRKICGILSKKLQKLALFKY